jgi:DNA-binding response OmpR family regulator
MAEEPSTSNNNPFVLIIEHDPELRKVMEISLKQAGVEVESVSQYANALYVMEQKPPDVFIVDVDLRDGKPGKLIHVFRECRKPKTGIVLVSTSDRLEDDWRRKYKPDSVIYKPFDIRYLIRLIGELTSKKEIEIL